MATSMRPPFLTLDPTSPFNLSPPLSPKPHHLYDNNHGDVSPITPGTRTSFPRQQDLSRVSGFPQAPGFNFDLDNDTNPTSPSGERQPSARFSINTVPVRQISNTLLTPPGGLPREQDTQAGVVAPPPYEGHSRLFPGGRLPATRSSITAGQFPTGPSRPAPTHGRGRYSGVPRSFNGQQRHLYPLTLTDTRDFDHGTPPQGASERKASWRIFGASESLDGEMEKKPLTRKGKWFVYIAAATILLTMAIVGALVGTLRPKGSSNPPKAIDLSGFPTLPTGLAVVMPQGEPETPPSACVLPATLWSCNLPPDTFFPTNSSRTDTNRSPKFMFTIGVQNASIDSSSGSAIQWAPVPERVPSDTEYASLADADGIQSSNKSGEATPFFLSMQTDQNPIAARDIDTRSRDEKSSEGEELDDPKESANQDARRRRQKRSKPEITQTPSMMLPTMLRNQPLRLFDRGLNTEHYGFFIYYNKTIHVLATNVSDVTELTTASDANGGVSATVNSKLVTWENTRFKVAIWTKKRANGEMYLINDKGQRLSSETGAFDDFFPYPVSVIEDRYGNKGDVSYENNLQTRTIVEEEEGKGCFCEWRNWRSGAN